VERIETSKLEKLSPVKVYREDLEYLLDLFTKTCGEVWLCDEEFKYDSLAEIEGRKGMVARLPFLEINGHQPYVSLSLGARKIKWALRHEDTHVYAAVGDQSELLATRLSSYLSQRKRFLPRLLSWYVFLAAIILQTVWVSISVTSRRKDVNFYRNHPWAVVLEVCYYTLIAYVLAFPWFARRGLSLISLGPKHSHKSFWTEHGYDLFKSIFLVTLGILLKSLFDHLMK
jgi:hypothetical protein